jgi:hypothetical protein
MLLRSNLITNGSRMRIARWLGFFATLALHAPLVQLLSRHDIHLRAPSLEALGPGANAGAGDAANAVTLILIPVMSTQPQVLEESTELPSVGVDPPSLALIVLSDNPLPAFEFEDDPVDPTLSPVAADPLESAAARALLFGRYTGQIDARIERAWRKPRGPVYDPADLPAQAYVISNKPADATNLFRCQVRLTQDQTGNVKEIELQRCNGSNAWQQSLVQAILTASPLPAPPHPAVFSNVLTLSFESGPES